MISLFESYGIGADLMGKRKKIAIFLVCFKSFSYFLLAISQLT